MNARTEWRKVQEIIGTSPNGVPSPDDEAALARLRLHARLNTDAYERKPSWEWQQEVKRPASPVTVILP